MKIAWLSDIHLNFLTDKEVKGFINSIEESDCTIITGDISDGRDLDKHLNMIDKYTKNPVYFVLGNHDYYHSSFSDSYQIADYARENILFLDPLDFLNIQNKFIVLGCSGFADGGYGNYWDSNVYGLMNDFKLIRDLKGKDRIGTFHIIRNQARLCMNHIYNQMCKIEEADLNLPIFIATHVPPFEECLNGNDVSRYHSYSYNDYDFFPFFGNKMLGNVLLKYDWQATILCGHTHNSRNLQKKGYKILMQDSEYYKPKKIYIGEGDES